MKLISRIVWHSWRRRAARHLGDSLMNGKQVASSSQNINYKANGCVGVAVGQFAACSVYGIRKKNAHNYKFVFAFICRARLLINLSRLSGNQSKSPVSAGPKTGSAGNKLNSTIVWRPRTWKSAGAKVQSVNLAKPNCQMLGAGQLIKNKLKLLKCYEDNYQRSCPCQRNHTRMSSASRIRHVARQFLSPTTNFCKRFLSPLLIDG